MDTPAHFFSIILTGYAALLLVRTYTLWGRNRVLLVSLLLLALVNSCPQLAISISVTTSCRAASQDLRWSVPMLYRGFNVRFITALVDESLVWLGYHVDQDPPLGTSGCYQTQRIAIYAVNYALLVLFETGQFCFFVELLKPTLHCIVILCLNVFQAWRRRKQQSNHLIMRLYWDGIFYVLCILSEQFSSLELEY